MTVECIGEFRIETPSHINHLGDPRVPFREYVNPSKSPLLQWETKDSCTAFRFSDLPVELQEIIVEACDAPAQFILSTLVPHLRTRARSLFFANRMNWYHIESARAVDTEGAWLDIDIDPTFAQHVQQVELECHRTGIQGHLPSDTTGFWDKLLLVFPALKRLVVTYSQPNPADLDTLLDSWRSIPATVTSRVNISISIPVVKENTELAEWTATERVLYRLGTDSQWTIVTKPWTRQCILPPQAKIKGQLGRFLELQRRKDEAEFRCLATSKIREEIFVKHHFHGPALLPIICSVCQAEFYSVGQRKNHIDQDHSPRWKIESEIKMFVLELPEPIDSVVAQSEEEAKRLWKAADEEERELLASWGLLDHDRRDEAEAMLLEEIKTNPIFGPEEEDRTHWMMHWINQTRLLYDTYSK